RGARRPRSARSPAPGACAGPRWWCRATPAASRPRPAGRSRYGSGPGARTSHAIARWRLRGGPASPGAGRPGRRPGPNPAPSIRPAARRPPPPPCWRPGAPRAARAARPAPRPPRRRARWLRTAARAGQAVRAGRGTSRPVPGGVGSCGAYPGLADPRQLVVDAPAGILDGVTDLAQLAHAGLATMLAQPQALPEHLPHRVLHRVAIAVAGHGGDLRAGGPQLRFEGVGRVQQVHHLAL